MMIFFFFFFFLNQLPFDTSTQMFLPTLNTNRACRAKKYLLILKTPITFAADVDFDCQAEDSHVLLRLIFSKKNKIQ